MLSPVVRAAIVAFTASFCTLVIELVAGRVLAPYVGVSLYTWTSIIGVVLAGISGGAYAGGWLADRRPVPSTLGLLLLAAGFASILIAPATNLLASDDGLLTSLGIATTLLQRVVLLSFVLFFLPAFFLGMISPVAVKLAVKDVATAGSVVGKIYALSTLGSILGTFVTGFWLVARFGTRTTLVGVGVTLIAAALLFGGLFGKVGRALAVLLLAGGAAYAGLWPGALPPPHQDPLHPPAGSGIIHYEESQYYTIQVDRTIRDDTGAPLHALHLDHLVHSYADLDDPSYLEYGYLRTFNDVIDWRAKEGPVFRLLFIGGGGYTLPRLVDAKHPSAQVDVVEIDPAVTRVARRFFGVGRDAAIRTVNEDARWFAMRRDTGPYDIIFIDAFNDLSVPYHLTTRELTARLKELMTYDGALVVNLIDDYNKGRFLASYVRTLQSVFGERNVAVLMDDEEDMDSSRSTFVVIASRNLAAITAETAAWLLPHDRLQRYLVNRKAIVLTDDFSPVDNMLATLFTERFVDEIAEE
jgi:predicted membrane-bound spermidine synthase